MPARLSTPKLFALLAVLGAPAVVACSLSLNPQPLPPDDEPGVVDPPGSVRPTLPKPADAGPWRPVDAGPPVFGDAGSGHDSGPLRDAAADATTDAMVDAGDAGILTTDSATDATTD